MCEWPDLLSLRDAHVDASCGLRGAYGRQLVTNWKGHLLVQHVELTSDGQLLAANLVLEQLTFLSAHFPRLLCVPVTKWEG